jgi:cobalamin biosynthesis Mg chelatase CobN
MAKFELPVFDLPTEAARPLYAGVGATDLVVGFVRDAFADLQKQLADVQKDVQARFTSIELEPKALRDQAVTVVTAQIDALSKDAKARREAIEARVAELQTEANSAYADLAKRGETLVGRIRTQESTKATATAAKTTTAKAKTTKTQATTAAKKTTTTAKKSTKSTAKKTTSTAKKTSAAPKSSAKATVTAAQKTAAAAVDATTDAAAKVGD